MIKKIVYIACLFVSCNTLLAQQQVLGSNGATGNFALGTIDYTVGECMVTTYFSGIPAIVKVLTQGFQQPVTAIDSTKTDSPVKFYSGITPNGDGENDIWEIDGINIFPDNTVSIFNRWGEKVWSGTKYDNVKVVWDGKNNTGQFLPDATYFYVVELNKETYKGWVELTK